MVEVKKVENPVSAWVIGVAGWLFPGAGHFIAGKYERGAIILVAVVGLFITGVMSNGTLFPGEVANGDTWQILHRLHYFASSGNALLYGALMFFNGAATPEMLREAAKSVTFEYGGKLIEAAGLLNYLAAMDAFDIAARRKS